MKMIIMIGVPTLGYPDRRDLTGGGTLEAKDFRVADESVVFLCPYL
jgi:hypothetical protein